MDWEKVRNDDGTIDLEDAFYEVFDRPPSDAQKRYLWQVQQICRIRSRQVAATAIANANEL